jgi:hypothetical protein
MDEEKIESVTFYKQSYYSTQIFEKNNAVGSLMKISLPRVKFLEKDGEYRPAWAVEKDKPKTVIPPDAPAAQHRAYKKETRRKLMYKRGGYPITPLEQKVFDLFEQGLSVADVCEQTRKTPSTVSGAYKRYQIKILANKK